MELQHQEMEDHKGRYLCAVDLYFITE